MPTKPSGMSDISPVLSEDLLLLQPGFLKTSPGEQKHSNLSVVFLIKMRRNNMCEHHQGHDNPKSFVKGAFLGALVGAVLGVLFAPESGEKTRKKLKDKSGELVEKGLEAVEQAADKVEEVKDLVEPYKERAEEFIHDTEERAKEEADNIKKRYFKGTK
ncbi:TPA: hypothetical protein DEP93_02505 [candidate division WWE3 bacterium]|uniref:YtxH domain-containing protein n=1 Tax=candidate division WWE3 bacterium TaxID=2053526 RepID=A0A3D0ZPU8_UNCKA|nr:hypothetical protein [candidate division WWE3 bacterium]HCC42317.1 hypothetical protein [candidate division WWE3 bacterium]